MISITLDNTVVAAGDRISGSLTYSGQDPLKKAAVGLFWRTEGRGTAEEDAVNELQINLEKLCAHRSIEFSFTTPTEGPVTYNGSLLRIIWEVRTTLTLPKLMAKKEKFSEPFSVVCRQA